MGASILSGEDTTRPSKQHNREAIKSEHQRSRQAGLSDGQAGLNDGEAGGLGPPKKGPGKNQPGTSRTSSLGLRVLT